MSLPNGDDDDNGRPPWRDPFSHRDDSAMYPTKKLIASSSENDADDRTADETSIGSMSFSSDMASIAATGANLLPSTPMRMRSRSQEAPTSALTADSSAENDDNTVRSGVSCNAEDAAATQLRRSRNRRQLQRLGVATGAAFALFVYMLIPTALLLSMILFGSVSSTFLYQLSTIMRWEFHRSILEGRGIGDYLPQSIYDLLTSTSVHDFLSDPDGIFGASEHLPYLMLYLIPGLTQEQLDQYVNRLSPTHQRLLRNEQGMLGFLLNRNNHRFENPSDDNQDSTIMRFIIGDERIREWRRRQGGQQRHPSNITPRRLELPPTIPEENPPQPSSRIPETETRENARPESAPEHLSTGIPSTVAAVVDSTAIPPAPLSSTRDSSPQSPTTRPNQTRRNSERSISVTYDMVLVDAIGSAMSNIVGDATNSVRERAQETFRQTLATPIYRVSLGVTALGLGVGAYGLSNGTYDLQSFVRPIGQLISNVMGSLLGTGIGSGSSQNQGGSNPWVQLSLSMPSVGMLMGSTVASGTTAVVLGLFGMTHKGGESSSAAAAAKTTRKDQESPQ